MDETDIPIISENTEETLEMSPEGGEQEVPIEEEPIEINTGGTSDYEELENLPQINGVELKGNKTAEQLGIRQLNADWNAESGVQQILNRPNIPAPQVNSDWEAESGVQRILNKPNIPKKVSDLENDLGFITGYTETDPVFSASPSAGISSGDIQSWNGKSESVVLCIHSMYELMGNGGSIYSDRSCSTAMTWSEVRETILNISEGKNPKEVWLYETSSTDAMYKVSGGYYDDLSGGFLVTGLGGQSGEEPRSYRIFADYESEDGTFKAEEGGDFTGATSSVAGSHGLVPAPTTSDTGKYLKGDGTWSGIVPELVEMFYGESNAWQKFITAYNAKCIVYCRASSNANPGTGAKTRKAFMAYVNKEDNPTSVEFQYYRSVSSHSDSQQGDQVFIYQLTNANGGTWSVTTRNAFTKIEAGAGLKSTYNNGTLTISLDA